MEEMKKELKKLCKKIREEIGSKTEYPKAIMTFKQMELKTASINCGNISSRASAIRDLVLSSNDLKVFKDKFNILSIEKETTTFKDLIIRLRY